MQERETPGMSMVEWAAEVELAVAVPMQDRENGLNAEHK
jgi:hypothetical protein